jgi:epoxyqueuosine reductase
LNNDKEHITETIRRLALQSGFDDCGFAPAIISDRNVRALRNWLNKGYHGSMQYMENHFSLRSHPDRILPGARSAVVLLYNYFPGEVFLPGSRFRMAKYTWGRDYHAFLKTKLNRLIRQIRELTGTEIIRGFTDSAPVMEKALAHQAGLGWVGKNTLLIHPRIGSFFFIAEILTDLELQYDTPGADRCGHCTRCIDACPTGALTAPYTLDARRCIAYLTIENNGDLPVQHAGQFNRYIFGCDICQDVCPWNRFSQVRNDTELVQGRCLANVPQKEKLQEKEWWLGLSEGGFSAAFGHSALQRAGYDRLIRNIDFVDR